MNKIRVLCQFIVELEMTDEDYARRHFIIEDNGCPGTGVVGAKIVEMMDKSDDTGLCWACAAEGTNKIVSDTSCRKIV